MTTTMNKVIFLDHDGGINRDAENACLKLVKTVPNVCFKIDEICFSENATRILQKQIKSMEMSTPTATNLIV